MRKFLIRLIFFIFLSSCAGEVIIRIYRLTPDIPERYIDKWGLQRYKSNQSGYYTKAVTKWRVNDFGWLGTTDTSKDTIVSVIGDSYIENIMNPISCNQGNILASYFPNFSFFEAGRSGVSFIEAMEISRVLDSEINSKMHLLYVGDKDFYESISSIRRYNDIVQIDLQHDQILKAQLSFPKLKKLLYSSKLLYYLYLRFPVFVSRQNLGEIPGSSNTAVPFDYSTFDLLFNYCAKHYNTSRITLVFHPGTKKEFVALARKYHFKTIFLDSTGDKAWALTGSDEHWSCYGHSRVAKQVASQLLNCFEP